MPSLLQHTVILGTGGTIAGTAADPGDNVGYTAAQRSVGQLLAAVPALAGLPIEAEQVAQLDSKDMDHATWQRLAQRVLHHLARDEVSGVVITHGTDTLEETAFFLHLVLPLGKPVVLTAAMRPATALAADGPQNLLDAVAVARLPEARGVLAVLAGQVHLGSALRKAHSYRPTAFSSGDAGPLGVVEEGQLRRFRPWPGALDDGLAALALSAAQRQAVLAADPAHWPWVAVLSSHAGVRPEQVTALLAAGLQGLVLAATGNGSVHQALAPALAQAAARAVPVWRCTRCAEGVLVGGRPEAGTSEAEPSACPGAAGSGVAGSTAAAAAAAAAGLLTAWQARVALTLQLLAHAPAPVSGQGRGPVA